MGEKESEVYIVAGVVPVSRCVSARPKLEGGRFGLNDGGKRLPSQSNISRVPKLRVPSKPADNLPSEVARLPVGLDNERRSSPRYVPRPFGALLMSGSGSVELSAPEMLAGIDRHDIDGRDVKPQTSPP